MRYIFETCLLGGALLLFGLTPGNAAAKGSRLSLANVDVAAVVSLGKTEVTGSLQFENRRAEVGQKAYDLYFPVFVPIKQARSEAFLNKHKPSLSIERRLVRLTRVKNPRGLPHAPAVPGQTVVWWRTKLGKPRPGEKLIVDFRYEQKNFAREGFRGFVFLPVLPGSDLGGRAKVKLSVASDETRLHLKSGKSAKPVIGSLLKGRFSHPVAKSITCKLQHFQPIVVELVAR